MTRRRAALTEPEPTQDPIDDEEEDEEEATDEAPASEPAPRRPRLVPSSAAPRTLPGVGAIPERAHAFRAFRVQDGGRREPLFGPSEDEGILSVEWPIDLLDVDMLRAWWGPGRYELCFFAVVEGRRQTVGRSPVFSFAPVPVAAPTALAPAPAAPPPAASSGSPLEIALALQRVIADQTTANLAAMAALMRGGGGGGGGDSTVERLLDEMRRDRERADRQREDDRRERRDELRAVLGALRDEEGDEDESEEDDDDESLTDYLARVGKRRVKKEGIAGIAGMATELTQALAFVKHLGEQMNGGGSKEGGA